MRFFAGGDIGGGPAVRCRDATCDGFVVSCLTWPGAYLGALWRNLLGPLYVPFSPALRRRLRP